MPRNALILAVLMLACTCRSWAGSCQSGSLAAYMTPGFTCTEGSLTFSSFSYAGSGTNAASLSATQITVTPSGESLLLEGPWNAGVGQSLSSVITYTVSGSGVVISGVDVSMLGFNAMEGGQISVSASAFGNGTLLALLNYAQSEGLSTSSAAGFDPPTGAQISTTILVTGNNGQADLSYVENQWIPTPATPEAASALLFGLGLAGLTLLCRRAGTRHV